MKRKLFALILLSGVTTSGFFGFNWVNGLGNSLGESILTASKNGDLRTVRSLLRRGADVRYKDRRGATPIHWASHLGHQKLVEFFVEWGVDPMLRDRKGWTPIHWASSWSDDLPNLSDTTASRRKQREKISIIEYLIENGASIVSRTKKGQTARALAEKMGLIEVTNFFMGEEISLVRFSGDLIFAATDGNLGKIKYLIHKGVKIDSRDSNGMNALHWSSYRGHLHLVQYLIEEGADLYARDKDGWTALHWASFGFQKQKKIVIVRYLVAKGINPLLKSYHGKRGKTARQIAEKSNMLNIRDFLKKVERKEMMKQNPMWAKQMMDQMRLDQLKQTDQTPDKTMEESISPKTKIQKPEENSEKKKPRKYRLFSYFRGMDSDYSSFGIQSKVLSVKFLFS